jgi:hypothetical protein
MVGRDDYAAGTATGNVPTDYPPTRAAGRGRGWYRGDCHVHSTYSDGELTPAQLAAAARAAGLDFIATTEHNTADAHGAWGPHAGDDLLVILGEEVTTPTGHWLALGIEPTPTCRASSASRTPSSWPTSTTAILAGLRAGHSWIAGSADVELTLEATAGPRHAGIGDDLPTHNHTASVRAESRGLPSGTVSFHTDRGKAHRESWSEASWSDAASHVVEWPTSAAESAFVRVEVRHPDGHMAALTNPIALT